jgi:hypothetical protein
MRNWKQYKPKLKKLKDYGESKKFKEFIDLSDKYEREIGELQAKSIRLNSEVATHNANIKKSRSQSNVLRAIGHSIMLQSYKSLLPQKKPSALRLGSILKCARLH